MPTKHCSWQPCNSDSRYKDREHMKDVLFFKFPDQLKDPEKYNRWLHLCGRADLEAGQANNTSCARWPRWICSKHFVGGRPTDAHPHPFQARCSREVSYRYRPAKEQVRLVTEWKRCMVECCFTSTETVGLLGTGAQDGHLVFHTAPEL